MSLAAEEDQVITYNAALLLDRQFSNKRFLKSLY